MATYSELYQIANDGGATSPLRQKIAVACIVAAETIRTENPATTLHTERLAWAKAVFRDPLGESLRMTWAVLAQNAGQPLANINGATDGAIQTAVNNAVNVFAV